MAGGLRAQLAARLADETCQRDQVKSVQEAVLPKHGLAAEAGADGFERCTLGAHVE